MKKILISFFIIIICFFSSCNYFKNNNYNKKEIFKNNKIKITTTLFPQYDFAKNIVGEKGDVQLILPYGVDIHSFEPTAIDIKNIYDSDLFIYTCYELEPWTKKILNSSKNFTNSLNISKNIELLEENTCKNHYHSYDPHIWLDPNNVIIIIEDILKELIKIDYNNKDYYTKNAKKYISELKLLDNDIKKTIETSKKNTIVFAGKFSYKYFFKRYNLKYITVYSTCSSNEDPSIKKIASVVEYIKNNNTKYIYHEEFSNPNIAKSIAEKTNVGLLIFNTCHNIKKEDINNKTYIKIMRENLENIKKGLEC